MSQQGYVIAEKNGVKLIQFSHLNSLDFLTHGFSSRVGGVSPPPYDTMNLGYATEDEVINLMENRARFMSALGKENLLMAQTINLVHGDRVVGDHELPDNGEIVDADGIITQRADLPLVSTFADCIPIFLADPVKKAIGVVHAGWRGTLAGIAARAVKRMQELFKSKPEDILAGIGPGIGPCCFETGEEPARCFMDKYPGWKDLVVRVSNYDKWKIDLFSFNRRILQETGVPGRSITIASLCTLCREDLFFSYRRDGRRSGRMAAVMIKIH